MKLIDADVLLNNTDGLEHVKYSQEYGHVVLVCDIVYAPPVDAVEVVRCKDCKYHKDEVPGMVWCPYIIKDWVNDNWYCAEGKRKEEVRSEQEVH